MTCKFVLLLVVMTTSIRGYVPAFRNGVRKIVWGLRLLAGRCLNGMESMAVGIDPGTRPTCAEDIEKARTLIPEGFAMLEGMCTWWFVCVRVVMVAVMVIVVVVVMMISLTCLMCCCFLGSTPIGSTPPVAHVVLHYVLATDWFGNLDWSTLLPFERFNKKLKHLVGNTNFPIASLTNAMLRDAGSFRQYK